MFLKFSYSITCISIVFFFMLNNTPLYEYSTFFIHPSVDENLGCFHFLAIVNNASMDIGALISVQVLAFNSFRYTTRMELLDHISFLCPKPSVDINLRI